MLGCKDELKAPFTSVKESARLSRRVNGVIIQHHEDDAFLGVMSVDELKKVHKIRAFVALSNETVDFARNQINTGKQR